MTLKKGPFENILGKGENAGRQYFLLIPKCFRPFSKQISIVQLDNFSSSAFNLDLSNILSFSEELIDFLIDFFYIMPCLHCRSDQLIKPDQACLAGALGTLYFGQHHSGFLPKNF